MKITKQHYDYMTRCINEVFTPCAYEAAQATVKARDQWQDFDDAVIYEIVNMAYKKTDLLAFTCDTIYAYADDTHLATAYKRIMATLKKKYCIND